jgi:hypothetical protein
VIGGARGDIHVWMNEGAPNRLIHDSVALMNGGYKRLLRGG